MEKKKQNLIDQKEKKKKKKLPKCWTMKEWEQCFDGEWKWVSEPCLW